MPGEGLLIGWSDFVITTGEDKRAAVCDHYADKAFVVLWELKNHSPMSVTIIIIAITCIVSFICFNDWKLRNQLIFNAAAVKERGEYYRFISHGFVHNSWMHLGINMYVLYVFGQYAEYTFQVMFGKVFGAPVLLLFYLTIIVVASVSDYYRHQDNYAYSAAGASGGVEGLMWPLILLQPWTWFIFPPLPAIILGPAYILYSVYKDRTANDNIGHNAHLWGAVFGLVAYVALAFIFAPELLEHFFVAVAQPQGPNF